MKKFYIVGVDRFTVLPVVEKRIQDWDPVKVCWLCREDSMAIKPKAHERSWNLLTKSQDSPD